jgi:DNA-binding MarR family transcriptional regulator
MNAHADPAPLDQWLTYRFGLVTSRVGRLMATMVRERHGLKLWEWRALAVVGNFEPLSAKDLAARTSTDPILVARAIGSLTGKGLITRQADPQDRRRAVLRLTDDGRRIYAQVGRASQRVEQTLTATLTDSERAVLDKALGKIDRQVVEQIVEADWREFCR